MTVLANRIISEALRTTTEVTRRTASANRGLPLLGGIGVAIFYAKRHADETDRAASKLQETMNESGGIGRITVRPPAETLPITTPRLRFPIKSLSAPPPEYVTLKRDVEVTHGSNKVVIPKGSKLLVVSRGAGVVEVRFGNESEVIPESATGEGK